MGTTFLIEEEWLVKKKKPKTPMSWVFARVECMGVLAFQLLFFSFYFHGCLSFCLSFFSFFFMGVLAFS
jgi:hypothetical protein